VSPGEARPVRGQSRHHRCGQVSGGASTRSNRSRADRGGGVASHRRCRAVHRRDRRHRKLSGSGCTRCGLLGCDGQRGPQRHGDSDSVVRVGDGDRRPDRPRDRGVHGRGARTGRSRRRLPVGVGVDGGPASRRQGVAAVRRGPAAAPPGVDGTVRSAVGGQLARASRAAVPARIRAHAAGTRSHRAERPTQRRPESRRRLPGSADDGRLSRRADDIGPVVPLRL
jgi:hypothetical protein